MLVLSCNPKLGIDREYSCGPTKHPSKVIVISYQFKCLVTLMVLFTTAQLHVNNTLKCYFSGTTSVMNLSQVASTHPLQKAIMTSWCMECWQVTPPTGLTNTSLPVKKCAILLRKLFSSNNGLLLLPLPIILLPSLPFSLSLAYINSFLTHGVLKQRFVFQNCKQIYKHSLSNPNSQLKMAWKCEKCNTWNGTGNGTCSCGWQIGGRNREDIQLPNTPIEEDNLFGYKNAKPHSHV